MSSFSVLQRARAALANPSTVADETAWAALAGLLGLGGASLSEAVALVPDESGIFGSVKSWYELVQLYVAKEDAFGRVEGAESQVPYPLASILPSRGHGAHSSVPQGEYEALMRRTSLGDFQLAIPSNQGFAVVRNRAGAIWTIDLKEHWGSFLWGISASLTHTLTVVVQGDYVLAQRGDVVSFETVLEVYKRDPVQHGHYARVGQIVGAHLLGSNSFADVFLSISLSGNLFAVLRPNGTVATFNADTLELVHVDSLPAEVQENLALENHHSCTPIHLMGDRTLVVSVRGEVVAIHLSTQAVQWRLSEIVAQATVVQARVQASEAEQAPKSTLSKVHLDPTEASALEAIGSKSALQIQAEGSSLVLAGPKALVIVPDLTETQALVVVLPSRRPVGYRGQSKSFYGPSAALGCAVSLSDSRVLWLTQHAPFLLDFSLGINSVRAWTLWSDATTLPTSDVIGRYEAQTLNVLRSMAQHQEWVPQAVLTPTAAYLLGTLRGTASHPDDLLPRSNQIVTWEFGATALGSVDSNALDERLATRPLPVATVRSSPRNQNGRPVETIRAQLAATHLTA